MTREQAEALVKSIKGSTATKHPKQLIAELCSVVEFLLKEVKLLSPPVFGIDKDMPVVEPDLGAEPDRPFRQPPRPTLGPDTVDDGDTTDPYLRGIMEKQEGDDNV